jgi:N-acetylglucosamine-6-phosphate deacetylase
MPERTLVPGFVDIHIHGAFGIDFMSATGPEMKALCGRLAGVGYEGFLPTTVSASQEDVLAALDNLPEDPMILGIHLEGPFLSPQFPGAQPLEAILDPPTQNVWDTVFEDPRLRIATLAPELPGGFELTRRLVSLGVIVSMGHTAARFDEAAHGFEAGATHTTHTFNAMKALHQREAGTVGYALLQNGLRCELIYDRLHVCRQAAELLLRCKPLDGVMAVSDGTMASGLPDGSRLTMWKHAVETRGGGVYLAGTDTLAGSAITLLDAFRNLSEDFGIQTAARLCCLNPRRALAITSKPRVYVEFDRKMGVAEIRQIPAA